MSRSVRTIGVIVVLLSASSHPAADRPYDPSTLVYPTFGHDLGFHHVNNFHLRLFTGNRHRFRSPKGIVAVKLTERDLPDKTRDDDELTVYGVNSGEHCLIYNTSETSLASYGTRGSGAGQFLHPWGIAADPAGNVYVADSGNHRIVHLRCHDGKMTELRVFRGAKGDPTPFRCPRGVALATDGRLFVADTENHRIVVMNRSGSLLRVIGEKGAFSRPEALTVLDEGERWSYRRDAFLVVIDREGTRVQKLSLTGELLGTVTGADLGVPTACFRGVAIDYYHQVYLTDETNHQIHKLDDRLRLITSFGREGDGDKEFNSPFGITVWRRFGQFFVSERTGAQYYWVGVDVLDYYGEPARFNPHGRIRFTLTERARVSVYIENEKGRMVRTVADERSYPVGKARILWDGRDNEGRRVPPGLYRVRIEARATYSSSKHYKKEVAFPITVG